MYLSLLTRVSFGREGGERRSESITLPSGWQWALSNAVRFCARKGKILRFVFNVHNQGRPDQQGLMQMSSTPQSSGSSCIALPEPSVCEVWFAKPTDDDYWLERQRVTLTHHCPTNQTY